MSELTNRHIGPVMFSESWANHWRTLDPFRRMEELKALYLHNENLPYAGFKTFAHVVRNLRRFGVLNHTDDLFMYEAGKAEVPVEMYTKKDNNGVPQLLQKKSHYDETRPGVNAPYTSKVTLPVAGVPDIIKSSMVEAYKTDMPSLLTLVKAKDESFKSLKGQITIATQWDQYSADTPEYLNKKSMEAWNIISPAFRGIKAGIGKVDSNKIYKIAHKEYIQKYAYQRYLDTGVPYQSGQDIIDDLYGGSDWLINTPNFPGKKSLIPKVLPFSWATDYSNEDMEFFINLWAKEGDHYKDSKIRSSIHYDDDSNVTIYPDVASNGAGLTLYWKNSGSEGDDLGREDEQSFISWKDFGEWTAMKHKFHILSEIQKWFHADGIPFKQQERSAQAIELIARYEAALRGEAYNIGESPKTPDYSRMWIDNSYYDDADNVLGLNQNPDHLWQLRHLGDFSDEANFIKTFFGLTELGFHDRKSIYDAFKGRSSEALEDENLDQVLNEAMIQYVIQEEDWWKRLSEGSSAFAEYAKDRSNLFHKLQARYHASKNKGDKFYLFRWLEDYGYKLPSDNASFGL
jgi:hypothetical protein